LPPWVSHVGGEILANATPPNDIVNAITTAEINNAMRFLISSHLLFSSRSPFSKTKAGPWSIAPQSSRLHHWLPMPQVPIYGTKV
jgi:hypothetical protein